MDIVVERLRRRPLFYYEAINKQLNEGGPRLISIYINYNSDITETE